jgi:hypothetical protein
MYLRNAEIHPTTTKGSPAMICPQPRIDAKRRRSSGPVGPLNSQGEPTSRAEDIRIGLCSSAVVHEDASVIQGRAGGFYDTLSPQNDFHAWCVSEVALTTFKIDRCQRMERRARDKLALRAELCWDDDRKLDATLLGEQLGNRPEVVVDQLRRSLHGCEWMMTRWAMLARADDEKQGWTPAQKEMAFDLLATPREFREGREPGTSIDFHGRPLGEPLTPADVARREVDALEERREMISALDEANRALAMADLNDEPDAEVKRLHRYEARLHTHLRWCVAQIRFKSPFKEPLRGLKAIWLGNQEPIPPRPKSPPLPEPIATPPPFPEETVKGQRLPRVDLPFDLEPDEFPAPGQRPDLDKILAGRQSKRLKKAEARRQAKRHQAANLLG